MTRFLIAGILIGHSLLAAQSAPAAKAPARVVVERQNQAALEKLKAGDTAAAEKTFLAVLRQSPSNATAHTYLAVIAEGRGDLKAAERHFRAAAMNSPRSADAQNNHGVILLRMDRPMEARKRFEAALKINPQQKSALVNLAQLRLGDQTRTGAAAARELLQRAWAVQPDGDVARGLLLAACALQAKDEAAQWYREYSTTASGLSAETRMAVAAALHSVGELEAAGEEIGAVLAAQPANMDAVALRARVLTARGEVKEAGKLLEMQVAAGRANGAVYAALAEIYEQTGHLENAIPAMRLALDQDPANESYIVRYGLLLIDSKAPGAAVIRMREAAARFPRSARIAFTLGLAHFHDTKNQLAAEAFSGAVKLDPNFAPGWAYLGMTQTERGDYAAAEKSYGRALELDPALAAVHYLAADALVKQEARLEAAHQHLERATQLDPHFARAWLALGKLQMRNGRMEQAADHFERAVNLEPELAEAHYQLGRAYTRLRQPEKAKETLARYEQLNRQQKEAAVQERQELVRRLAKVNF